MNRNEWLLDFSTNLRLMMRKNRITQIELADKAKISRRTVNRYINCEQVPSAIAIANMSKVLNCDIGDLIWLDDLIEE